MCCFLYVLDQPRYAWLLQLAGAPQALLRPAQGGVPATRSLQLACLSCSLGASSLCSCELPGRTESVWQTACPCLCQSVSRDHPVQGWEKHTSVVTGGRIGVFGEER